MSDHSGQTAAMMGRRTTAGLCVLLVHALFVVAFVSDPWRDWLRTQQDPADLSPRMQIIDIPLGIDDSEFPDEDISSLRPRPAVASLSPPFLESGELEAESGGVAQAGPPGYVDWPKEGREAAARVLAREADAERIAKLFAGPQGTWASLTRRQQSEFNHFRWRPGVDGLERDEKGNTIYHLPNGCVLVNFMFFGCPIGKKPPAYGDLFKDMRQYFDEQRLPETDVGNGTEPESRRPPRWSKPLP